MQKTAGISTKRLPQYEKAEVYRVAALNSDTEQTTAYRQKAIDGYNSTVDSSGNPNILADSAVKLNQLYKMNDESDMGVQILEKTYWDVKDKCSKGQQANMVCQVAEYYKKNGNDNEALDWYERYNGDGYWSIEYNKANLYNKLGDYNNAIRSYRQANKYYNNKEPVMFFRMSEVYLKQGDYYNAKKYLNKTNNSLKQYKTAKKRTKFKNSEDYKELVRKLKK